MMPSAVAGTVFFGMLAAASGLADSVTFIDTSTKANRSLNGILTAMSGGTVMLEARFASGPMTYKIPISTVRNIEFNPVAFNPGAPPQVSFLAEGAKAEASPPQRAIAADAIELRGSGGALDPCKVVSIDETTVRCEATGKTKPKEYPRTLVLRIVVKGQP